MATDEYGRPPVHGVPTGPRELAAVLSSGQLPKPVPKPTPSSMKK